MIVHVLLFSGLCVMMWRIYLFKRVSSLVSLMEKVGKAPKDRLCKKEIDMDAATATEFMSIVCDYMSIFMQVGADMVLRCDTCRGLLLQSRQF